MKRMISSRPSGSIAILFLAAAVVAPAQDSAQSPDWPRWRGPNGNGITEASDWTPDALASGARLLWKIEVGRGYSAVSIKGDRAYTMGNANGEDKVVCLSAATGETIWSHGYPCKAGSYAGPRATPVIDGSFVYTLSRDGQLFCLQASTGTVVWGKNIRSELDAVPPRWGFAGSPVVVDDVLLLNAGPHGLALDKTTGKTIWSSGPGMGGYSAPVVTGLGGKRVVLLFGRKSLFAVDFESGRVKWQYPWETSYDVNAADPVPIGDKVFITSGYRRGSALLDVSGSKPESLWETRSLSSQFSSTVRNGGYLYGIDGNAGRGRLVCMEISTGKSVWTEDVGFGSLIMADEKLIVLNEKGTLRICPAEPGGYTELARADDVLPSICWTAPVLCRGKLYLRNDKGTVVCLDMRQP